MPVPKYLTQKRKFLINFWVFFRELNGIAGDKIEK